MWMEGEQYNNGKVVNHISSVEYRHLFIVCQQISILYAFVINTSYSLLGGASFNPWSEKTFLLFLEKIIHHLYSKIKYIFYRWELYSFVCVHVCMHTHAEICPSRKNVYFHTWQMFSSAFPELLQKLIPSLCFWCR
jgi:hypothetical protein